MAADEHLGTQFRYHGSVPITYNVLGHEVDLHTVTAHVDKEDDSSTEIGSMAWSKRGIGNIFVEPEYRRRGIATGLMQEAQRLAAIIPDVPMPEHSANRTTSGDKWAKAVGGKRPRRRREDD